MTSPQIRQSFFDFFKSKNHDIVPSAPIVVKNDPTLMFTNAGMNQFKDYFLGNSEPKSRRIANTQKCLRVSGKHNDLEEVGVDTYHHTMFEMLGNWSFGDYFKKEAIEWAWELLTEKYEIDKERIYVTVFAGDKNDGLPEDTEAKELWRSCLGGTEDHILPFGRKENFWEMGDIGPCGPCSEIHLDIRDPAERKKVNGKTLVNKGHPQVIEIWNNVFIQYERKAGGKLITLPSKHIDTGMGFERLCMVLQGKKSNYDTDVFQPTFRELENITNIHYGKNEKSDIAMRVVADHLRAISFSIADGQLPSNTGAGYVIRRILRRAVRYGYSFLDRREPFIYRLVSVLVKQMGDFFPELKAQQELIRKVIHEEEVNFLRTLDKGINRFIMATADLYIPLNPSDMMLYPLPQEIIPGRIVFELYDTFGFPVDLTQLLAKEKGMEIDMNGFEEEMQKQKNRSRKATETETSDWVVFSNEQKSEFVGYEMLDTSVNIIKYRIAKLKGKEQYDLVFDNTPFYAESGGQVGDTGFIESKGQKIYITDTKKENNLILHFADKLPSDPSVTFHAVVDTEKRLNTENNHSATHLLHFALRKILGTHVQQKGSLVHPDYLRFDFSHFQKLTEEDISMIESLVNERIRGNSSIDVRLLPVEEAKKSGALALFGEKYGDVVRVVRFGESVELCGGTHVNATGKIGYFKIISESAVAAGIRRIEAVTATKAEAHINRQLAQIEEIKELLKHPKDLSKSIQNLLKQNAGLQKQVEQYGKEKAAGLKDALLARAKTINGIKFIGEKLSLPADSLKDIAFQLKAADEPVFIVIGTTSNDKANIAVALSDKIIKEKNLSAGNIVRELAKEILGGGGGSSFYATAGGKNVGGIEAAIRKAKEMVEGLGAFHA